MMGVWFRRRRLRLPNVPLILCSLNLMQRDLKDTLNLPQTGFPMRADLVSREPKRFEEWEQSALYARLQQKNAKGPRFLLHDGPPFTNGDIHIGTALS